MLLVAIGWMYVVLMMAIAEAMHPNGTLLGAVMTVVFYGALPLSVVLYIMGSPGRRAARKSVAQSQHRVNVTAVLLAAGAGERMGYQAKALLQVDGQPLITRLVSQLYDSGIREVVVVLGHHADAIQVALADRPISPSMRVVRHENPNVGQAQSLRLGLRAVSADSEGVLLALVDQPLIDAADIGTLLDAFGHRGDCAMVVPRVQRADGTRQPGNPVVIDRALAVAWAEQAEPTTGRAWRELHPERVHWLDTRNTNYVWDVDTPSDISDLEVQTGLKVEQP
jgi:molybdenum cofactor cytidylyltransferase